jgi:UDP-galactose transporter B1
MTSSVLWTIFKLVFCVTGIYGAYITQGYYQETLSTKRFGSDAARFPHLATLNAFQSWACFIWAFFLLTMRGLFAPRSQSDNEKQVHPPPLAYWKAGLTNCVGPAFGFQALYYMSYPAQVLAKSSKMIPVMVLGTILHNQRYPAVEYFSCLLVSAGVGWFAASGTSSHARQRLASPNPSLGYLLCFMNLGLDGFTNVAQDQINKKYKGGSAMDMMCWMNFWTGLFYLPYMFIITSAGQEVVSFCMEHQQAAMDVMLFCCCGAIGQLFIFETIRTFGSLTNTLITTTRKFFSILTSVVLSGSPLKLQQWIAVVMVFTGLIISSITKHRRRRGHGKIE